LTAVVTDPPGDERRVSSCVQRGPVAADLGVTLGDRVTQLRGLVVLLALGQRRAVAGLGDATQRFG
jgi:hypothetical protein